MNARSVAYENECSLQEITFCARYKMADEESNMALLEVGMISGYVPDRLSLLSLLKPSTSKFILFSAKNLNRLTIAPVA